MLELTALAAVALSTLASRQRLQPIEVVEVTWPAIRLTRTACGCWTCGCWLPEPAAPR